MTVPASDIAISLLAAAPDLLVVVFTCVLHVHLVEGHSDGQLCIITEDSNLD